MELRQNITDHLQTWELMCNTGRYSVCVSLPTLHIWPVWASIAYMLKVTTTSAMPEIHYRIGGSTTTCGHRSRGWLLYRHIL